MKKKNIQQWIKDLMFYIISTMDKYDGVMSTHGYAYPIKGAIEQYSIILRDEISVNINLYHKYASMMEYKNILMSRNAYNVMQKYSEGKIDKKTMESKLHGEHMTPTSYIRNFLSELIEERKKLGKEEIKKRIDYAFTHAKYCIITKEESKLLDGKGKKFSSDEIKKFLSAYKKIHPKLSKEEEDDYRNIEGKSKKSSGFGAIRLFVLQNAKVEFVNSKGKKQTFGKCVAYLEDGKYTTI